MFEFDFMRQAFLAASFVSVACGVVGWFLVLRGQSFAGHALSHIGFAGATGAILVGLSPLTGMIGVSSLAAVFLGWESDATKGSRLQSTHHRDSLTGLTLAASLGLGLLFLSWQAAPASSASSLLFGNLFGVDASLLRQLVFISIFCVGVMLVIARPLLHASLDPDLAALQGRMKFWVAMIFAINIALITSVCTVITGVLLVFALLVGPAVTMMRLGLSPIWGVCGSAVLAFALSWLGIALSWWTNAPASFWISAGAVVLYGLVVFTQYVCAVRVNLRAQKKGITNLLERQ